MDWIKRATRVADEKTKLLNITDWVVTHRSRKWQWALQVTNHPSSRWTKKVASWEPQLHSTRTQRRKQAHPRRRWNDDIQQFLQQNGIVAQSWVQVATDNDKWTTLEQEYINGEWRQRKTTRSTTTTQPD